MTNNRLVLEESEEVRGRERLQAIVRVQCRREYALLCHNVEYNLLKWEMQAQRDLQTSTRMLNTNSHAFEF